MLKKAAVLFTSLGFFILFSVNAGAQNYDVTGDTVNPTGTPMNYDTITIQSAGAALTANASDITTAAGITNDQNLTFNGGTNANIITGTGALNITGAVINNALAAITQNSLLIDGAGSSFTANASDLTIASGITNNTNLIFNGGTNSNAITGTGTLGITGTVTNTAGTAVTQNAVDITGALTANASDITATTGITNTGTLTFNGGTLEQN